MEITRKLLILAGTTIALTGLCGAQIEGQPWKAAPETIRKFLENVDENGNVIDPWIAYVSENYGPYNYIEEKVGQYTLPNPLILNDGTQVNSPELWTTRRREEIMELFRKHMYGRRPEIEYSIHYEILNTIDDVFDSLAIAYDLRAVVSYDGRKHSFPFTVFIPKRIETPLPAIIHIRFGSVSVEKAIESDIAQVRPPFVGSVHDTWPVKELLERGYATASYYYEEIDTDEGDRPNEDNVISKGIRTLFAGDEPLSDDAWGDYSAWGWGASRILDYFESLDSIDNQRIAVTGHSRLGATALWAACEDTRFALAYSVSSGATGAKLTRRNFGDNIEICIDHQPHFYSKAFSKYMNRGNELPIDQHELIALIAPRGVYVSSAGEDLLADPRGEYLAVVNSAPVFKLLGNTSITNPEMPPQGISRVRGNTGYHIRPGPHSFTHQDWDLFLNFAETLLK